MGGDFADVDEAGRGFAFEEGKDGVLVVGWDAEEEAAAGLGVGEEETVGLGNGVGEGGGGFCRAEVGAGAAGDAAAVDEGEDLWIDDGEEGVVEFGGDLALAAHAGEVAEEAEAGDVGAGADEALLPDGGAGGVEGGHELGGGVGEGVGGEAAFDGGGDDAGADRFGEVEEVARFGTGVGDDVVGVDESGDGEAVEGLGVLDGVAAGEDAASLGDLVGTAAEDGVDDLGWEDVGGDADDVHGGDGASAHGVDVGEGIGGGDLAVEIGVVHDGGEKIEGLDEGALVIEAIDGGVVGGGGTDEEIGVVDLGEAAQNLREFGLADFGGSSSAGGQGGEFADLFAGHAGRVTRVGGCASVI